MPKRFGLSDAEQKAGRRYAKACARLNSRYDPRLKFEEEYLRQCGMRGVNVELGG